MEDGPHWYKHTFLYFLENFLSPTSTILSLSLNGFNLKFFCSFYTRTCFGDFYLFYLFIHLLITGPLFHFISFHFPPISLSLS